MICACQDRWPRKDAVTVQRVERNIGEQRVLRWSADVSKCVHSASVDERWKC